MVSLFNSFWGTILYQNHFEYLGVVEPITDTAICKSQVKTISISSQISAKEQFSQ